ncbi:hypothetical protein K3495_g8567 [Podosphaera aphanis]|nr:hypothetical protein K3495_g8567 [Podosphaera aphanis]
MAPLLSAARLKASLLSLRQNDSPLATITADFPPHRIRDLAPRITPLHPGDGVTPPDSIPNLFVFIVFGLIGAGCVCTALWFFFVADNGGFQFKETDWDDYKSSVMSRIGPNGTILSRSTKSSKLGLDSTIYDEKSSSAWGRKKKRSKKYSDFDEMSSQTASSFGKSEISSKMTVVSDLSQSTYREKRRRKKNKARRGPGSTIGTIDEEMSDCVADDLIAYRHEKPARVGGLNKESDASAFDGSTNCGSTNASEILSHRSKKSKSIKAHKDRRDLRVGGIRKVFSTSEGTIHSRRGSSHRTPRSKKYHLPSPDGDRIKSEAKRLQEKGRAAQRRDFSFQPGDDRTILTSSERTSHHEEHERRRSHRNPSKRIPGSFMEESVLESTHSDETGTKAYHHPIPELTNFNSAASDYTVATDYTEERRRKRNAGKHRHG